MATHSVNWLRRNTVESPKILLVLVACLLVIATACTPEVASDDGVTREPSIAPSATVLPLLPTEAANSSIGRSEPTSAALVGEGDADEDPALTLVVPTAQYVPLNIITADGRSLDLGFYGAAVRPAPNILLLHDSGQDGDVWVNVAPELQAAGYNVFTANLSGRRQAAAEVDWPAVVAEVEGLATYIGNMTGITSPQLTVAGIGTGADVALVACGRLATCNGVIAISPRNDVPGLNYIDLNLSTRSVLLMSADDDTGALLAVEVLRGQLGGVVTWQRYTTGGRGIQLLRAQPDALSVMRNWLRGE